MICSRLWLQAFKLFCYLLFFPVQFETKAGKAAASSLSSTDALDPPDLKVALKREREEHQHLLAESYAAVMDLTKQVFPSRGWKVAGQKLWFCLHFASWKNCRMSWCINPPNPLWCFPAPLISPLWPTCGPTSFRSERETGAEKSWSCWRGSVRRGPSGSGDWERPQRSMLR